MAANLHTVHSHMVKGVALHAGGTYGGNWDYEPAHPFELAQMVQKEGGIDDLKNLYKNPVFIHSGSSDQTVPRPFQIGQQKFYDHVHGVTKLYKTDYTHTWPVDRPAKEWPVEKCSNDKA